MSADAVPTASATVECCDVAIVGAGPAGLGAAARLAELGVRNVRVLDREGSAGGTPRHCGHYPFGVRELGRLLRGPDYARRLVDRARRAGVSLSTRTTVVSVAPGPRLTLSDDAGVRELCARRVVLATGTRERSRAARFIGGTRPEGVMSTNALQALVYLEGVRPFSRPVIAGTELVSFSAILTCRHAGIRPRAMVEERARVTAFAAARGLPWVLRMPVYLRSRIESVHGSTRLQAVTLRHADGTSTDVEADGLIVSGDFVPEATLARESHLTVDPHTHGPAVDQYGRCSDANFFAAGNVLRSVETAGWCWSEGRRVACAVAADLRGELPASRTELAIDVADDALAWALPQRIAVPPSLSPVFRDITFRARHPLRGTLEAGAASATVSALPERRLSLPLAQAAAGQVRALRVRLRSP